METRAGILSFSKRLLAPGALAVREKLLYLADRYLDHDIHVDTLLGMHFDPVPETQAAGSFLIFDFYRIFLYENCALPDGPRINSVVRSLIDDHPISPIPTLADHAQEFYFFHPVEVLEVLPLLWCHRRPGIIVTLDLSNAEIRTAQAFVHPECELPRIEASAAQQGRNQKPLITARQDATKRQNLCNTEEQSKQRERKSKSTTETWEALRTRRKP